MNNAEHKQLFTQCIEINGVRHQIIKAIEELSELSVELAKVSNYDLIETNQDKICDEIADVKVMIAQLEIIFPSEHINKRYEFKLNRLHHRLNPIIIIEGDTNEPTAL